MGIVSAKNQNIAGAIFYGLYICGQLIGSSIDYWPMLRKKLEKDLKGKESNEKQSAKEKV